MSARRITPLYRLAVAGRVAAAALGGYAASALFACWLAVALPIAPIDAAITGTLAAILLLPGLVMACFWVRSARAAWGWMIGLCLLFGAAAWAAGWRP